MTLAIQIKMHKRVDGQLHVTRWFCHATPEDIASGRLPVWIYKAAAQSGTTRTMVRDLIEKRITDYKNVVACEISEVAA